MCQQSTILTWKLWGRELILLVESCGLAGTLPWIGFCGRSMIKPNELGQPVTEADLLPFVNAQAPVYSQVIEELTAGCKRTRGLEFSGTTGR